MTSAGGLLQPKALHSELQGGFPAQHGKIRWADPRRWMLVTGALLDIPAIARQSGLAFRSADGGISHNRRSDVMDSSGRARTIFVGNKWTCDELVAQIVTAAKAAP